MAGPGDILSPGSEMWFKITVKFDLCSFHWEDYSTVTNQIKVVLGTVKRKAEKYEHANLTEF